MPVRPRTFWGRCGTVPMRVRAGVSAEDRVQRVRVGCSWIMVLRLLAEVRSDSLRLHALGEVYVWVWSGIVRITSFGGKAESHSSKSNQSRQRHRHVKHGSDSSLLVFVSCRAMHGEFIMHLRA